MKIKTYKPSNTSLVNNSVDAFNVLFSNQRPKRIIDKKRKKSKHLITEWPTRPKCASILANDSFQRSTEDTFDKLKQTCKSPVSNLIHNSTVNTSKSLNKSEAGRFISMDISINSPILTRQKKKFLDSSSSLQITDSYYDKSHLKRLNEPSEEKINQSLEMERIKDKQYKHSSLSYINVPNKIDSLLKTTNSFNCSKLGVSIDNFSKSLHKKLLTNCSTPVSQFKHPNLINQTMSPLKINSLVHEESRMHMESSILHSQSTNLNETEDISKSQSSDIDTPQKRKSFITLRKRKILKRQVKKSISKSWNKFLTSTLPSSSDLELQGYVLTKSLESFNGSINKKQQEHALTKNLESFSDIEKQGLALTTSLESFTKFENKIAYISKKYDNSKDFKSFGHILSPVNFVTKRKCFSKDTCKSNDVCFSLEESKELETNEKFVNSKNLFVKLERLPFGLTNSSITSLESDFEKFYSQSISMELGDTELENKTDKSVEMFEQFYSSNYNICSQDSDDCLDISFVTLRKKSAPDNSLDAHKTDVINLSRNSIDEFENFYVSHYSFTDSKDVDRMNDIAVSCTKLTEKSLNSSNNDTQEDSESNEINCKDNIQENKIIKDLQVNITKKSLRPKKEKNYLEVSNDLNTNNNSIINLTDNTIENKEPGINITDGSDHNNPTLRIGLTRNNFSDLMTASRNDSVNTIECNISNNKSTIDLTSKSIQVDKKSCNVGIKNLMVDITQIENFEMFYKDNYDIYNCPLPTVEVIASNENELNLADEESLDIIESSYIKSPLLYKPKKKSINNSLNSKTISDKTYNKLSESGTIQNLNNSSNTSTSVCQKLVDNSCYIVDKSVVSNKALFDKGSFKIPKSPQIYLKGGKSWKRSMSNYRNSIIGFSKDDGRSSCLSKTCPKGKLSRLSNQRCSRRLTVCIAPISTFDLENITQNPVVEYALNNSYVPDQIIEDSLEGSFRCLSLNHVNTLNKSRLDQVPITAKDVVLRKCGQTEPLEFSECFPDSILSHCHKIGEGVFGEVFLFRNPKGGTSVIKIVPVEGDLIVNGERQKKFEEVLSEIIITMELSNLRNNKRNGIPAFTEVQKIQCVQGRYPEKLVFLWDEFDEARGSENDCPDIFREDQLYIVFQMAYGGKDLESFEFNNAMQSYSMFQQVAIGLAVAEEELHFEHRDLHWGNVLISAVEANKIASFNLNNRNYELPTLGVEVAIIDFTLSRIEHNGVVIFNDLSVDPDLFVAEGDYQFDIYRLMQDKNRNNWKDFEPFTNLLWLHYILDKAIKALRYKNVKSKKHKDYLRKLKMLKEDVLCYHNVKEFVFAKLLDII